MSLLVQNPIQWGPGLAAPFAAWPKNLFRPWGGTWCHHTKEFCPENRGQYPRWFSNRLDFEIIFGRTRPTLPRSMLHRLDCSHSSGLGQTCEVEPIRWKSQRMNAFLAVWMTPESECTRLLEVATWQNRIAHIIATASHVSVFALQGNLGNFLQKL